MVYSVIISWFPLLWFLFLSWSLGGTENLEVEEHEQDGEVVQLVLLDLLLVLLFPCTDALDGDKSCLVRISAIFDFLWQLGDVTSA